MFCGLKHIKKSSYMLHKITQGRDLYNQNDSGFSLLGCRDNTFLEVLALLEFCMIDSLK